jgi:hypothetical protein
VYCKVGCYIGQRLTQICGTSKEAYALVAGWRCHLIALTSLTGGLTQRLHMSRVTIEYFIICHRRRRWRWYPAGESQVLHDKVLTLLGCRGMSYGLCRYSSDSLGERWRCTPRAASSPGNSKWRMPRLCNSRGEALEASIDRGRLR